MEQYPILVLGGYGNFGKRISRSLANEADLKITVAGRSLTRAQAFARQVKLESGISIEAAALDIAAPSLADDILKTGAKLVIHTCGPFQGQPYTVAQACIEVGANYLDLSDDRHFVANIHTLDKAAKEKAVLLISGASSVPGLSSAVVKQFRSQFNPLRSIRIGIAPGNRAERGRATTKAILSYTGKPYKQWLNNQWQTVYGWQNIRLRKFPKPLGRRWLANCEIPDLELFPKAYPNVETVTFQAGLELSLLHLGLWFLSGLSRVGLVKNWSGYAESIARMSGWFEYFGSDVGGMYVTLKGEGNDGQEKVITWNLVAGNGEGPHIPTVASIILAKKIARNEFNGNGALPCIELFTVKEFMDEVKEWDIHCFVNERVASDG